VRQHITASLQAQPTSRFYLIPGPESGPESVTLNGSTVGWYGIDGSSLCMRLAAHFCLYVCFRCRCRGVCLSLPSGACSVQALLWSSHTQQPGRSMRASGHGPVHCQGSAPRCARNLTVYIERPGAVQTGDSCANSAAAAEFAPRHGSHTLRGKHTHWLYVQGAAAPVWVGVLCQMRVFISMSQQLH
jgi:hypothetical protein